MSPSTFLLLNLGLAFYNVGTIWAHEVDIFRTWKLIGPDEFRRVQAAHWHKLPYWVFIPVGVAFAGSVILLRFHPSGTSMLLLWAALAFQFASLALTAVFWGRWQAKLSHDAGGGDSPYLARILKTHWIRTALISFYALALLVAALHLWGPTP